MPIGAEPVEALPHPALHDVLEVDDASTRDARPFRRSATTSGVPPCARDALDDLRRSPPASSPPLLATQRRDRVRGALAELRDRPSSRRSCAWWRENGTKVMCAWPSPPLGASGRAGRTSPWPARRCCALRASRRAARRAAPGRPAPRRVTPPHGTNSTACRLPSVIVPVLSSSSVFTSPAASTARPLIAITFCWIMRSMPAMPIADSSPPMVVGMRHTSSAIRTGIATARSAVDRERLQRDDREQEDDREPRRAGS